MAQWLIGAMAVVAIGLVIVHRLPRAEKAATAVHGAVAPASESAPVTAVIPSPAIAAPAATAPPKPARTRRTATSASAEGQATQVPGIAVTPERDGSQTAGGRLAVEVATFIFEDRAETERDRLVAAGQDARVLTESENGAPSYRVVVGSFRSHRAANRAADALLSGGLVQQARVVTLPSE
jgi:cell division protein FtsN